MKYANPGKITPPSKPWTPPKELLGKPMSGASAFRGATSGYGKVTKVPGGKTEVPKLKSL